MITALQSSLRPVFSASVKASPAQVDVKVVDVKQAPPDNFQQGPSCPTPPPVAPVQPPPPPAPALKVDRMTHLLSDPASKPMVDALRARYQVMDKSIDTYAPQWRSVIGSFYSMFILPFRLPTDTALGGDVGAFDMGKLGLSNGDNGRPAVTQDALKNMISEWPKSIAAQRAKLAAMPPSDATRRGSQILDDMQRVLDVSARPLLAQMQAKGIGSIVTDVVTAVIGRR